MIENVSVNDAAEWMSPKEVADLLDVQVTKVHRRVRDGQLLAMRTEEGLRIPRELLTRDERIERHITGTITLLRDAGLSDNAALEWLFAEDEVLGMTPAHALHGHKAREVKRRAQGL